MTAINTTPETTDSIYDCEREFKDSDGMDHEAIKKRLLALGESETSAEQMLSDWENDLDEERAAEEEEEQEDC